MTTLEWADDKKVELHSVQELDEQLDVLDGTAREGEPFIAAVVRPEGSALTIGLGRDESVLNYSTSLDPPYFTSYAGASEADGTVVFYYWGHWSEFPADMAVPMESAREAVRRFFENGDRPDNIDWRQD